MTTRTVQGSSSSSTVTRSFTTSSTTYHSQSSSNHFSATEQSENPTVFEAIKRLDKLSIEQSPKKHIPIKDDKFSLKKSETVPSSTVHKIEKFQLDCLNAHNDYRRKHGVGPMKLSPALSNFAQTWANVSLLAIYSFPQTVMCFSSTDNSK